MNQELLIQKVERKIFPIRGQKVMLSIYLAELYGVKPRALVQAVKRNIERFPHDFMFRLTTTEFQALRSQFVILETGRGEHPKYPPYAFTEQGVAMLSGVLRSKRAVQVNIAIMRVFVKLRQMLAGHKALEQQLAELEHKLEGHDAQIRTLFEAIRQLMTPPEPPRRRIGFHP